MVESLPPLLDIESLGMEGMVLRLPRAQPRLAGLRRVVGEGLVVVTMVLAFVAGSALGVLAAVVVGSLGLLGSLTLFRAIFERPEVTHFEIQLGMRGLMLEDEELPWGEVASVAFRCQPPTTDLVVTMRDASTRTLICKRRSGGDAIGVTRRQREWLEATAARAVERAGSRELVPGSLGTAALAEVR